MGFQANVLKILIASPGDVAAERDIVTGEIHRWNAANADSRKLMLHPVRWETHSSPAMGDYAQNILNKQILLDADIVVGIFGTRVGTATKEFISGSVEEVKRHVTAGRLAMVYFSSVPVNPNQIDAEQWAALQAFKDECRQGGLYADFDSHENLRSKFGQHLSIELNKPRYLWLPVPESDDTVQEPDLGDDERRLLIAASGDSMGQIVTPSFLGGFAVQTNRQNFVEDFPRSAAKWKTVLRRLTELGYLNQLSGEIYELTTDGYARADREVAAMPLRLSLALAGTPDNPMLSVESSKPITIEQLDFLMPSGASVTSSKIHEEIVEAGTVPLDHGKLVELFSSPRPDKHIVPTQDPAALRVVFDLNGHRHQVALPIVLEIASLQNRQWTKATGSGTFTVE